MVRLGQDEEFDEPLNQLTRNGSLYTANITVPEDAEGGPTRMRVRLQYYGTLTPCGTTSYGEVEDYTVDVQSGFIISVEPTLERLLQENHSRLPLHIMP